MPWKKKFKKKKNVAPLGVPARRRPTTARRAAAPTSAYLIVTSNNGHERIRRDALMYISAPFVAKSNPESRVLGVLGFGSVFILNTPENCARLGIPAASGRPVPIPTPQDIAHDDDE